VAVANVKVLVEDERPPAPVTKPNGRHQRWTLLILQVMKIALSTRWTMLRKRRSGNIRCLESFIFTIATLTGLGTEATCYGGSIGKGTNTTASKKQKPNRVGTTFMRFGVLVFLQTQIEYHEFRHDLTRCFFLIVVM
jgi:hypothetical protein